MSTPRKSRAAGRGGPAGTITGEGPAGAERRAHLVVLAGELFAQKGYRATTVRETRLSQSFLIKQLRRPRLR